jgi:alpha-mannosidase
VIRHPEYMHARLAQVSERLRRLAYLETRPADEILVSPPVDRIPWEDAQALEYRPAVAGERFGPVWTTYWLRGVASVPDGWAGRRVDLLWDSGSEATLWLDGRPVQGLNPHHGDAVLLERAEGGEVVRFDVELACNGLFGRLERPPEVRRCEIAAWDPDAWELSFDFEVLRALAADAGSGLEPAWAGELASRLNDFCNVWPADDARVLLEELYARRNGSTTHRIVAVGHAHLDTAWLWPLAETYRKLVRTVTTQLRYADEYPEYRFAFSQAQHFAWLEERSPELWERVRATIDAGQFVPVGGTWVEPDCNLPSGESLVRQFLVGQRFFEQKLGGRSDVFWNPDVFGYNGQLPQIMRTCGIARFLTQKLSWNRFTKPEHQTFTWQGIDGSEVLAHFPPADTYNAEASVAELRRSARDYKDHVHSGASLLVFGHGDGGGGPTRAMLETLRRARDLQGVPRTEIGTPSAFFDVLEAEPRERPTVLGELYLEYHRGTYTSQARTKRGNRRCEAALHDAEFLSCAAGGDYPRGELERLWRILLLNQFHDILPGSSIRLVYEDAERDLAEVEAGADALCDAALGGTGDVPVNTIGVERREVADLESRLEVVEAAPYAVGVVAPPDDSVALHGLVLQNGLLRVELSPDGTLLSVVEKTTGRETLAAPGNRLELYDDRPVAFDAWDVDPFHLETRRDCAPAESYEVVRDDPLRCEIAFERSLGEASRMRQVVRLDAAARRVELRTTVDWHERHTMLKACFPLLVRAPLATYEMPFGYAERPTHFSTSWDRARFEVPGHRFADLSEHGFGAAVLTDCKYGYSCHGNELRVSLLRSPKSPDPEADMGRHELAYALMPHPGGWRDGGVVAEARRFNAPLRFGGRAVLEPGRSFARADDPNLVLDTVKRAEDSDALVLRLYEAHGARGTARVLLGNPVRSARRANALEDDGEPLELVDGAVVLPYRPHEIVTLKLA